MRLDSIGPSLVQKATVAVVLSVAALLGWTRLVLSPMASTGHGTGQMNSMASARDGAAFLAMWMAMVAAMMLPTVIPMAAAAWAVLGGAGLSHRVARWIAFVGAYVALWAGVGAVALGTLHVARHRPVVSFALIVGAAVYQLGGLKQACLRSCRAPLAFFMRHGQDMSSIRGAGWVGLRHGSVCVGCCAGLMVALTGAGVIDPAWIGVLALIVMLEKVHPLGQLLGRATGVALLLAAPFASYATTSAASARPAGLAALALVAVTALALGRVSRQPFPSEVR